MRQTQTRNNRKVTASVTLELEQLERIDDLARRSGLNRSVLVRDAIDVVLARYEKKAAAPARAGQGIPAAPAASRRP